MSMCWLFLFSAISIWMLSIPVAGNMESKLIQDLLQSYSKAARPVHNSNDAVNMTYYLTYISITLDEKENIQTTIAYENLAWTDQLLVWDPAKYKGIRHTVIDHTYIWTPDMSLYNSISDVDAMYAQGNAVVSHNGEVLLIRTMKSKVRCEFDDHHFPFNTASCKMTIGSWVYSGNQINLTLSSQGVDLSNYQPNPVWDLVNATSEKKTYHYACCPEAYYTIVYKNEFVRRSNDLVLVLLTPSFLLSVLTVLLLVMPNHSSEKVTLGILLFCAFFVILLYTYSLMPTMGHGSFFAVFLLFNLVILTLVTFLNELLVRLANCDSCHEVPKVLRAIVLEFLAKVFCMESIVKRNRSRHLVAPEYEFQSAKNNFYKLPLPNEKQPLDPSTQMGPPTGDQPDGELLPVNVKEGLETDVAFIRAFTRCAWTKMKDVDAEKRFSQGWRDVAHVINRLFFVLYVPVVLITLGVTLILISKK